MKGNEPLFSIYCGPDIIIVHVVSRISMKPTLKELITLLGNCSILI